MSTKSRSGKVIVNAAQALDVKHFIYFSADLGNLADTGVLGLQVKREIANHLKSLALPMGYTILQPAQSMDNLLPTSPFLLKVSRTILLRKTFAQHPEGKHQLLSTREIGRMGAKAITAPASYGEGSQAGGRRGHDARAGSHLPRCMREPPSMRATGLMGAVLGDGLPHSFNVRGAGWLRAMDRAAHEPNVVGMSVPVVLAFSSDVMHSSTMSTVMASTSPKSSRNCPTWNACVLSSFGIGHDVSIPQDNRSLYL
jgi:hypothetical protein